MHEDYRTHVGATNIAAGAGAMKATRRKSPGKLKFIDLGKLAPNRGKTVSV